MERKIIGWDTGLTSPGIAVVKITDLKPIGDVLMAECFQPKFPEDTATNTESATYRIAQITERIIHLCDLYEPHVIVAELPTGGAKSSSAVRGMAFSTATTAATLTAVVHYRRKAGMTVIPEIVYITPNANKKGSTGLKTWNIPPELSKSEVMTAVANIWPGIAWPRKKNRKGIETADLDDSKCWAISDSLSCIATYLRRQGVFNAKNCHTPASL